MSHEHCEAGVCVHDLESELQDARATIAELRSGLKALGAKLTEQSVHHEHNARFAEGDLHAGYFDGLAIAEKGIAEEIDALLAKTEPKP